MEARVFSVVIGVFLVIVGIVCGWLIPRVDHLRAALSERVVPQKVRRGANAYGKITYTGFCIASVLIGLFFVYVGLSDRANGWNR
jgi:uncharacterized membrane protein YciS (DUF1049 family)